jgi:hypothetical protein
VRLVDHHLPLHCHFEVYSTLNFHFWWKYFVSIWFFPCRAEFLSDLKHAHNLLSAEEFFFLSLHLSLETMKVQKRKWFVQCTQTRLLGLLLKVSGDLNKWRWFNIFRESFFVKWLSIDKGLFMLNDGACWDLRVSILTLKEVKERKYSLKVLLILVDQVVFLESWELSGYCVPWCPESLQINWGSVPEQLVTLL